MSTPAPTVASKPLRIAARVTAGLVTLQLVLVIGDIIGFTELGEIHGQAGFLSLASAIATMLLALRERLRGLGRIEMVLAALLPIMMGIQLMLSTLEVRGPHMFLGGLILLNSWVVAALVGGTGRMAPNSPTPVKTS